MAPTFIHKDVVDKKLCKDIVKYFEDNKDKSHLSIIGNKVDLSIKDSMDLVISANLMEYPFNEYHQQLQRCLQNYANTYTELNNFLGILSSTYPKLFKLNTFIFYIQSFVSPRLYVSV